MVHHVRIIKGLFMMRLEYGGESVMASTFASRQPQDVTWDEFKARFDGKYFPFEVRKRRERDF